MPKKVVKSYMKHMLQQEGISWKEYWGCIKELMDGRALSSIDAHRAQRLYFETNWPPKCTQLELIKRGEGVNEFRRLVKANRIKGGGIFYFEESDGSVGCKIQMKDRMYQLKRGRTRIIKRVKGKVI